MKDHSLTALMAVAEAGSIRAAARKLSLSQPAITKALRELEVELGAELLTRSYRGVRLTEAGHILNGRARAAQRQLRIARSEIQALAGNAHERLAVGVTPMVALSVLADVCSHFRRLRPQAKLSLVEGLPSIVTPALLKGELDFAVVMAEPAQLPDAVEFQPLLRVAFHVVGREGHPAAGAADLASLLEYEWIFSRHPGSYSERVLNWMAGRGLPPPSRIMDCNSTLSNWQLVRNTDMLTVLPAVFFRSPSVGALGGGLLRFDIDLPEAVVGILQLRHAPPSSSGALLAELFTIYLERLDTPP